MKHRLIFLFILILAGLAAPSVLAQDSGATIHATVNGNLVSLEVSWTNGDNDWHMAYWDDADRTQQYGFFAAEGPSPEGDNAPMTPSPAYLEPGTYTAIFWGASTTYTVEAPAPPPEASATIVAVQDPSDPHLWTLEVSWQDVTNIPVDVPACWDQGGIQCYGFHIESSSGSASTPSPAYVVDGNHVATFMGAQFPYSVGDNAEDSESSSGSSYTAPRPIRPAHPGLNGFFPQSVIAEPFPSEGILVAVTLLDPQGNWLPETRVEVSKTEFDTALQTARESGQNQIIVEMTDVFGRPVLIEALHTGSNSELQVTTYQPDGGNQTLVWNITPTEERACRVYTINDIGERCLPNG